jgi:hypothetical protein
MFANGSSYNGPSAYSNGQSLNGNEMFPAGPGNTEPFYYHYLMGIQPGALL